VQVDDVFADYPATSVAYLERNKLGGAESINFLTEPWNALKEPRVEHVLRLFCVVLCL
jgi:hypothetical protein